MRTGDILELAYGKSLPQRLRRGGEVPVYGSGGLIGWHGEAVVGQPTVIVGRKGTVGSVFLADRPSFPIDTTYWAIPNGLDPELVYWTLASLPLAGLNAHAAVPVSIATLSTSSGCRTTGRPRRNWSPPWRLFASGEPSPNATKPPWDSLPGPYTGAG